MNKQSFDSNYINKSDLIRTVYEQKPSATNKQIRDVIRDVYKTEVTSSLIIAAIGKHKSRATLKDNSNLLDVAKQYLEMFTKDLDWSYYWLKKAAVA